MAFEPRFPKDEEELEDLSGNEAEYRALDRISSRVTFQAIVFPILIAVSTVVVYLLLSGKMGEQLTAPSQGLAKASKDIEELSKTFSDRTGETEKSLKESISAVNKKMESIRKDMEGQANSLKELKKTRIDKEEVNALVQKELEKMVQSLNLTKDDLKKETSRIAQAIEKIGNDLKTQQGTIKELVGTKNDQQKKTAKIEDLEKVVNKLSSSIEGIKKATEKIKDIEKLSAKIELMELQIRLFKNQEEGAKKASPHPPKKETKPSISSDPSQDKWIIEEELRAP
ncbi:MAG: hypothetical protein V1753_08745 [Pseudomonadota bacterium]